MKKGTLIIFLCVLFLFVAYAPSLAYAGNQIVAYSTTAKVIVNGTEMAFDSYTINERTYFKLRDVALSISNSKKHFDVIWNDESQKIHIIPGQAYTAVGGEMKRGDSQIKYPNSGADGFFVGENWFEILAYEIDWNNYYSIRMLGELLNFEVYWDTVECAVVVDSNKDYTGNMPVEDKIAFYAQYDDVPDAGVIFKRDVASKGAENIDNTETVYYGYTYVSKQQIIEYEHSLLKAGFSKVQSAFEKEGAKISTYLNDNGRAVYTAYNDERSFFAVYIVESILD